MTIAEACDSLKLEAATREIGFVLIKNQVVANAGIFFVRPIGFVAYPSPKDQIRGFQIASPEVIIKNFNSCIIGPESFIKESAKKALDWATAF